MQWTADAISLSGLQGQQCLLSTDDEEIAQIGKDIGLEVPFLRPAALATDTANLTDTVRHAMEWVKQERGFMPDYLMVLQPTSPFRPPQLIREAFTRLINSDADAVIAVKPIHRSLGTLFYTDQRQIMTSLERQAELVTRRQDVRTLFTPNGAMYAIKRSVFESQNSLFPENCQAICLDQIQSHDIDDPRDWAIANAFADAGITWRSAREHTET